MILKQDERINEINENLRLIEKSGSLTFGTDAYLLSAYLKKRSSNLRQKKTDSLLIAVKSKILNIWSRYIMSDKLKISFITQWKRLTVFPMNIIFR